MTRVVNTCYHLAYKVIYRCGTLALRLTGLRLNGVFLYVWHGNRLLIVKNSYKPKHSLPGGLLKRHEDPCLGAVREAGEEVGLNLKPDQLTLFDQVEDEHGGVAYLVRVELPEEPAIRIDEREIVWADFVPVDSLSDYRFCQTIHLGLEHPDNPSAEPSPA